MKTALRTMSVFLVLSGGTVAAQSGTWSRLGDLAQGRSGHTLTPLNDGTMLVVGGKDASGYVATAEIFDPATGSSTVASGLLVARAGHTATALLDGRVLIVGGENSGGPVGTAEVYDQKTGRFSASGALGVPRRRHTATRLFDGRVLVPQLELVIRSCQG